MEKYKLQYDQDRKAFAIKWAHHRADYVQGDFYVRAIEGTTNTMAHNKANGQKEIYTTPYAIKEARQFIITVGNVGEVHDCIGLSLEDRHTYVDFDNPIRFRTMPPLVIGASPNIIDASAIRRQTWYEDTEAIISVIWGRDKVRYKISEWKLPQELAEQYSLEYKIKR